jgi:hypothetical protein
MAKIIARVSTPTGARVLAHDGTRYTLTPGEFGGDELLFDPKTTLAQAFALMHMYRLW